MNVSSHFSVPAAVALILGALAAVVLAVAVATKDSAKHGSAPTTPSATSSALAAPSDSTDEVEYQLDTNEPASE